MSSHIPTGPRRTLVTIQSLTETPDALGQLVASWVDVTTVWCSRAQSKGREEPNASQEKAIAWHALETAYNPSLNAIGPGHRALFNGKVCGITRCDNVGDLNQHFVIYCIEAALPYEGP